MVSSLSYLRLKSLKNIDLHFTLYGNAYIYTGTLVPFHNALVKQIIQVNCLRNTLPIALTRLLE